MSPNHRKACWVVAAIALAALLWPIASLGFHYPSLGAPWQHANAMVCVFLWALGPAIWFLVEWRVWRHEPNLATGQQYARDFWLGAGVIVLLFSARELSSAPPPPTGLRYGIAWNVLVDALHVMIWPLVVLFGFILFWKPLGDFLSAIGKRASKIGAFNVSLELAALPEAQPWSGPALDDLTTEYPAAMADSSGSLFRAIADTAHADYAKIDLKDGRAWLTSRLFILTTLISRVRPIQRIVFLHGPAETYLGECSPALLARALARACPWLEEAYLTVHVSVSGSAVRLLSNRSLLGPIVPSEASPMLSQFLSIVRMPGVVETEGWTKVGNNNLEHAAWVSSSSLLQMLGTGLNVSTVKRDPSEDGASIARTLLRHYEDYVAVVDVAGRFLHLVDRRKATDKVVRQELAHSR
jgi:hypothetical protein